ncbi:hypothetical protein F5X68DRAFT_251174 [Plectosphaerella plurivora]|uniref:Rhodopsin domain-containing protein n=1 Tax=Plectosphaerella plurivora TaxID=936078 RepID=A0A9P8V1X3_9PEZI|nr:hypothetical protein F5X68DRAFT_251174 [Plectosphaerella plurivora]
MDPAQLQNDETRGPLILASVWSLVPAALIFMGLRFYCKLREGRRLWWDDWALLFSWVMVAVAATLASVAVSLGLGRHMGTIPTQNVSKMAPIGLIMTTLIQIGAIWSKISFALTLLRITEGYMRLIVWSAIVSINIFMGLSAVFSWIGCGQASERLNISNCVNAVVVLDYGMFAAIFSGVMDIVLALLPWKLLWKLQMQLKEKMGVALAMSMGIFAGITGIIKASKRLSFSDPDFTFNAAEFLVWAVAEISVTIMAASIPALRVLVRDAKSSYHKSKSRPTATAASGVFTNNRTVISAARPPPPGRRHSNAPSDGSEEMIMGESHEMKIMTTKQVVVETFLRDALDSPDGPSRTEVSNRV